MEAIGRTAARASLRAAVSALAAGRGGLVLLTGEAGIGKTTAARELAAMAESGGARVVWAACWAGHGTVAHGPWLAVLDDLGADAADAADVLRAGAADDPSAAAPGRVAAYDGVSRALAGAARDGPLVVIIDDLHWADPGTLLLLAALAGRLPGVPVLVAGTYRDDEVDRSSPLVALGASADRIAIDALSPDDAGRLLGQVIGAEADARTASDVHRRTGGNPFLIVQVGRLLASAGDGGSSLPSGARDVLGGRLARLADDVRGVLDAAAVVGTTFAVDVVAEVAGLDAGAVLAALDEAAVARVVEESDAGTWSFVHDLFRQAVAEGLTASRRRELHTAAARALTSRGAPSAAIAYHHLAAATGPDVETAAWSARAAEEALAAMAWEEALDHFERARRATPAGAAGEEMRGEVLLGLGRAKLLVGERDAATDAFLAAAASARAQRSVTLLSRAALAFAADASGFEVVLFDQRQIDLLEEAARELEHTQLPALRAAVLARLSVALSMTATAERRLALAEQSLALARSVGDPAVLAASLAAHCDAIAGPVHVARRLAEATEIVELAERAGDHALELLGRRLRFVALLELGDSAAADLEAAAFARRADVLGNPLYSWYPVLWRAQRLLADGRVDDAIAETFEAEEIGARAASVNAPLLSYVLRHEAQQVNGTAPSFDAMAEKMEQLMGAELSAMPTSVVPQLVRSLLVEGRQVEAGDQLDRLDEHALSDANSDAEWLAALVIGLEGAATIKHPLVATMVESLTPYASCFAFEGIGAGLHGAVSRQLALGCSALGRHDEAVAHARAAVDANAAAGALLAAHARRTLGQVLTARGGPGDDVESESAHAAADNAYASFGLRRLCRSESAARPPADASATFERDGDVWRVAFAGRQTAVKHSKGMLDLARLLSSPGREVHVTELEDLPPAVASAARGASANAGEALDRRAVAEYRARLAELDEEAEDADAANDLVRAERARTERDFIVAELSASLGLGGTARAAGPDPVERLRKAVSGRIRDAIKRIDAVHPALGRHLTNAVRTGTFCSYDPESPVTWSL